MHNAALLVSSFTKNQSSKPAAGIRCRVVVIAAFCREGTGIFELPVKRGESFVPYCAFALSSGFLGFFTRVLSTLIAMTPTTK